MRNNPTLTMRRLRWLPILLGLAALLAACGTDATTNGTPTPEPDAPVLGTPIDLGAAPEYQLPAEAISTENANRLALLGRLDVPAGTASSIFAFDFSPDGTRLAALNQDWLMSWDLSRGTSMFTTSRLGITSVYYSPDKTELYAITDAGSVIVYNEAGVEQTGFKVNDEYNGVHAYNDYDVGLLALADNTGEVRIWDVAERTSIVTLNAQSNGIALLAFNVDATQLLVVGYDSTAQLWDWRGKKLLYTLPLRDQSAAQVAFAPDGSKVALGTDTYIQVFDTATGESLHALFVPEGSVNAFLRYTPDGRYLISAGESGSMVVWDATTGVSVGQVPEVTGGRVSAVISPAGDLMVTSVFEAQSALWNLMTLAPDSLQRVALSPGSRRIVNVGWTEDGFLLAFFDAQGAVYIWGIPA